MKVRILTKGLLAAALGLTIVSCDDSEDTPGVETPASYVFERDGASSVSFSGQTTRILMSQEILDVFNDTAVPAANVLAMYNHQEGAEDFADPNLNSSDKSARSKTAASSDFFSANATDAAAIKAEFDEWIQNQRDEVFPNWETLASAGVAGQIEDGSSVRYVNAQGVEYNQMFNKSLIGAMMTDQILNNYVSVSVLDAGTNVEDNDADVLVEGKNYTNMEHKWDEAYGYVYGTSQDPANPNATIGDDDNFLNKYIGRVEGDEDFARIADDIFNAFALGRAAIVAKNYDLRDQQAELIRGYLSTVIAVRAVYYLQAGKVALENQDFGGAFHDLSEGLGFVYSLQFTRVPGTNSPYLTRAEVLGFLDDILGGENGLWTVSGTTLDDVSDAIAGEFDFTVEQAAN